MGGLFNTIHLSYFLACLLLLLLLLVLENAVEEADKLQVFSSHKQTSVWKVKACFALNVL